jgi:hypothetical protein
MFHRLLHGIKTWLVGALLAAALFVVGRPAAAVDIRVLDEAKALQAFWKDLETDEHGDFQPWGLILTADGRYKLEVTDAKGALVHHEEGRYTYENEVLKLTVKGESKPYAEMHVELGDDTMDLKLGAKKLHWVKDRVHHDK